MLKEKSDRKTMFHLIGPFIHISVLFHLIVQVNRLLQDLIIWSAPHTALLINTRMNRPAVMQRSCPVSGSVYPAVPLQSFSSIDPSPKIFPAYIYTLLDSNSASIYILLVPDVFLFLLKSCMFVQLRCGVTLNKTPGAPEPPTLVPNMGHQTWCI